MLTYALAALVASPRALPDGLILVFQHPAKDYCGTMKLHNGANAVYGREK